MTNESILISEVIPATPQRIFSAWMDSAEHSAFTGDEATVVPEVGGEHQAAGGYIKGRTLELHEGTRIVQSWRTTEFPPESPDSRVEITLEPTLGGTLVTLLHTDIPVGQGDRYRQGWNEYYLSRLKTYFSDVEPTVETKALVDDEIEVDVEVDLESEVVQLDSTTVAEKPTRLKTQSKPKSAVKTAAKSPLKAVAKSPVKSPETKSPKKVVLKAKSTKPTTKSATKLSAKKPVKLATKTAAKAGTKASSKKPSRLAMKSTAKVAAKATRGAKAKKPAAKAAKRPAAKAKAGANKAGAKKKGASSARARRR